MISILLATYNGEKYIKKSIDSILNQTFKDFELLIGFNGTNDNSKDIVSNYNDERIKVFDYGSDKGKAKTLNKLIKEAKYDWVAIQDDDDIWLPTKLENQVKYLEYYDVIGTYINYIDKDDNYIGKPNLVENDKDIKLYASQGDNKVANTSAIFKKDRVMKIGGWTYNDGIEDFDLWLRLMKEDNIFYNIPEFLVKHRLHNESNFNTKVFDINKIIQ